MAGQGKVTKFIAQKITTDEWRVLFTCIPNTPHLNVVPIQTLSGSSKQRYPDIAAFRGNTIGLWEIEIQLSQDVAEDITTRFQEMVDSLTNIENYHNWAASLTRITGYQLPNTPQILTTLIVCNRIQSQDNELVHILNEKNIAVHYFKNY